LSEYLNSDRLTDQNPNKKGTDAKQSNWGIAQEAIKKNRL